MRKMICFMLMFSFTVGMCSCTDRHEPSPGIRDVGNGTAGGGPIPAGETFSRASRIRDVVSDPDWLVRLTGRTDIPQASAWERAL